MVPLMALSIACYCAIKWDSILSGHKRILRVRSWVDNRSKVNQHNMNKSPTNKREYYYHLLPTYYKARDYRERISWHMGSLKEGILRLRSCSGAYCSKGLFLWGEGQEELLLGFFSRHVPCKRVLFYSNLLCFVHYRFDSERRVSFQKCRLWFLPKCRLPWTAW